MDERSNTLPRVISSNTNKNSRPASYYDNYRENDQTENRNIDNDLPPAIELRNIADLENGQEGNPTQEFLLNTTVPQNIASVNIAGKHTPTRNSLRHSRMIVMSRTGNVPGAYQPYIVKSYKLATTLAALQAFLGVSICCLAAWLLLWAPNLRRRDNPYWSGLPLLTSGTFGLLLLCCCRRGRPGTLHGYLINGVKIFSIVLSLVAAAASLIASVFAIIHLLTLSIMECDSTQFLNETCVCAISPNSTYPAKSYHYADLKCPQVDETLTILLIFSSVVNAIAGAICLYYVYLHCSSNNEYSYSKVRMKSKQNNNSIVRNID